MLIPTHKQTSNEIRNYNLLSITWHAACQFPPCRQFHVGCVRRVVVLGMAGGGSRRLGCSFPGDLISRWKHCTWKLCEDPEKETFRPYHRHLNHQSPVKFFRSFEVRKWSVGVRVVITDISTAITSLWYPCPKKGFLSIGE